VLSGPCNSYKLPIGLSSIFIFLLIKNIVKNALEEVVVVVDMMDKSFGSANALRDVWISY